ncbi:hypothetical protein [Nocardiopsis sp. NRRL B-16309]|uniref:hypothetical protein n=1 Tax=Nocardiopsis sp. NRRL B-16309 TaxID=1519494 RepID=UPI0006AFB102|nr:hypothetical protein [Nocardiopsis sp. NRRL B-16309]KOX10179.1 hypothetical protein ADL05_26260 [Nocardiopsis sp. NRRL B-16309]
MKHPPAHLCHPCQNLWAAWGDAHLTATQLDGGGEGRRLQIIATQRADLETRCVAAGHERNRTATVLPATQPAPPRPASLTGARIKSLLDDFEALLPNDGRTREERLAAAVEAERAAHKEWMRTRQPWTPTPTEKKEGAA